jgi:hypothetical protein
MLVLNSANSVDLNYNNSTKLQTTNTGISVTGNVVPSGNVSGSSTSTGSFGRVDADKTMVIGSDSHGSNNWLSIYAKSGGVDSAGGITFYETDTYSAATPKYGAKIVYNAGGDVLCIGTMQDNVFKEQIKIPRAQDRIDTKAIYPATDATYDLGSASYKWGTLYTGNVTATGNISGSSTSTGSFGRLEIADNGNFPDNAMLQFGDSDDLKIYHGGSNSVIQEGGAGGLIIRASKLTLLADNTSEEFLVATENAGVEIYYNDVKKIETTSEGIDISGSLYVSGSYGAGLGAISASGDVVADGDIVAYNSSDERLKDNIQVIQGSLDKIDGIRGVEFDWNEKSPGWAQERGHDIGVIAQEVQKVVPEIVVERKNGYLGVDYKRLVPLLIESVKELRQEVEDLKKKVN